MKRSFRILLLFMLTACAASAADQKALERRLSRLRNSFPGEMAIYMKHLPSGQTLAFDADRVYETFSVIKVPIMVEVLRRVEAGEFRLSDRIELKSSDARWPSGVLYALDPGLQPTIKDLLTLMIIISDNSATDILADKVDRANITRTMRSLGLQQTTIEFSDLDYDRVWLGFLEPRFRQESAEGVMKFPFGKYSGAQVREAFRKAIYESDIYFGHSTAREMGILFEKMARKELVSAAASQLMIDILQKQQVDDRFPRYLRDVEIAHKTGDGQPFIANDAGILWVKGQPIVLVVFTGQHRGETAALHDAIARVAAEVGRHYGAALSPDYRPK
jgi:beta-lactamase class A